MARDLDALKRPQSQATYDRAAARRLIALLWPRDEPAFRRRFGLTIALMAGAAMLNAIVPLLFAAPSTASPARLPRHGACLRPSLAPMSACNGSSRVMNELRWSLYGPIEQRLQRTFARRALEHLHGALAAFHLGRRTGQISRILDNGLNGLASCCSTSSS